MGKVVKLTPRAVAPPKPLTGPCGSAAEIMIFALLYSMGMDGHTSRAIFNQAAWEVSRYLKQYPDSTHGERAMAMMQAARGFD